MPMSREHILHAVRTALGRYAGQAPDTPPAARLHIPLSDSERRIATFLRAIEDLAGKTYRASSPADACAYTARLIGEGGAVASNSPVLREWGIAALPGVRSGLYGLEELKAACASAAVGITSADYALADTGTLVLLSSPVEARMVSLLPPIHLAVVPSHRILTGLDELFSVLPAPADLTSSMLLITGPSRTADIEQILVRGVHGPGEIDVVVV
jgi:L-lactate dehydrogenase complex protein LldG